MTKIIQVPKASFSEQKEHGGDNSKVISIKKGNYQKPLNQTMKEEMINLYYSIDLLLSNTPKRAIQFIGSKEGEGNSTIIREFALACSSVLGKSVLLLDLDTHKSNPIPFPLFDNKEFISLEETIRAGNPIYKAIYQISNSSLFVSSFSKVPTPNNPVFNSLREKDFWEKLRQRFDLILVDSTPATISSDGLAISCMMDGVVFVFEAEKTRWPVAESVKDKIIKNGGNILGLVFNKRKYHIPNFLYKNL